MRDLYWVVSEDGKKMSKDPIPKERAKAQMRALYANVEDAKNGKGYSPLNKMIRKRNAILKEKERRVRERIEEAEEPRDLAIKFDEADKELFSRVGEHSQMRYDRLDNLFEKRQAETLAKKEHLEELIRGEKDKTIKNKLINDLKRMMKENDEELAKFVKAEQDIDKLVAREEAGDKWAFKKMGAYDFFQPDDNYTVSVVKGEGKKLKGGMYKYEEHLKSQRQLDDEDDEREEIQHRINFLQLKIPHLEYLIDNQEGAIAEVESEGGNAYHMIKALEGLEDKLVKLNSDIQHLRVALEMVGKYTIEKDKMGGGLSGGGPIKDDAKDQMEEMWSIQQNMRRRLGLPQLPAVILNQRIDDLIKELEYLPRSGTKGAKRESDINMANRRRKYEVIANAVRQLANVFKEVIESEKIPERPPPIPTPRPSRPPPSREPPSPKPNLSPEEVLEKYNIPLPDDSNPSRKGEARKAYLREVVIHHPDKGGDQEDFKELSGAYQKLYGRGLFGRGRILKKGGGALPPRNTLHKVAEQSYKSSPAQSIDGMNLIYSSPTLKAYAKDNTIVIGIRGTVPTDGSDLKADASIAIGQLASSDRFKRDVSELRELQKKYNPSQWDYYGVGHSLGGAILDLFISNGLVKNGVSYNPAVQPQDLRSTNTSNARVYSEGDPLYKTMGRVLAVKPDVRKQKAVPWYQKLVSYVPWAGTAFNLYKAHTLDNFEGGGTHRENFLKKNKVDDKSYSLEELAKISSVPLATLQEVYNRGIGAYKTNPTSVRLKGSYVKGVKAPMSKKLSKEQWAMARVYSFLDGNPKHDNDLRKSGGKRGNANRKSVETADLVRHLNSKTPWSIGKMYSKQNIMEMMKREGVPPSMITKLKTALVGAGLVGGRNWAQFLAEAYQNLSPAFMKWLFRKAVDTPDNDFDDLMAMTVDGELEKMGIDPNGMAMKWLLSEGQALWDYIRGEKKGKGQTFSRRKNKIAPAPSPEEEAWNELMDTIERKPKQTKVAPAPIKMPSSPKKSLSDIIAEESPHSPMVDTMFLDMDGKGRGKKKGDSLSPVAPAKFRKQLDDAKISPSAYLDEAKRRAKAHGYPYKLLGFAPDGSHKLAIPDENGRVVSFGKVGYGDHIIYSHLEGTQSVPKGTADAKQRTFQNSHSKIRGNWRKNPFSANNLALKILW